MRGAVRLLFGAVYLLLGCAGVGGLVSLSGPRRPPWPDWYWQLLLALFLITVAVTGLVVLVVAPCVQRHRTGPVLGAAPSGLPATGFPRSPFSVVIHVTALVAGFGLLVLLACGMWRLGQYGGAWLAAGLAAGAGWMVVRVMIGRVRPGGLWLTRRGVEYRKDALRWSVPWSAVAGVAAAPQAVSFWDDPRELLYPSDPVMVRLRPDTAATVMGPRWAQRQSPPDSLRIDSYHLAGGTSLITEMIEECLTHPRVREHLGTVHSLPRRAWVKGGQETR